MGARLSTIAAEVGRCVYPCGGIINVEWIDSGARKAVQAGRNSALAQVRQRISGTIVFDAAARTARGPLLEGSALEALLAYLRLCRDACALEDPAQRAAALDVASVSHFVPVALTMLIVEADEIDQATAQLLELREVDFCGGILVVVTGVQDAASQNGTISNSDRFRVLFTSSNSRVVAATMGMQYAFDSVWHQPWNASAPVPLSSPSRSNEHAVAEAVATSANFQPSAAFALVLDHGDFFPVRPDTEASLMTALRTFTTAQTGGFRLSNTNISCFAVLAGRPGRAPLLFPLHALRLLGPLDVAASSGEHPDIWAATVAWLDRGYAAWKLSSLGHEFRGAAE